MFASLVAFAILLLQSIPFCISLNVSFTTRDLVLRHCMCLSWSWVIHRLEHWPLRHRSLDFVWFDSRQTKVADPHRSTWWGSPYSLFPRICRPTIFHQSLINFLKNHPTHAIVQPLSSTCFLKLEDLFSQNVRSTTPSWRWSSSRPRAADDFKSISIHIYTFHDVMRWNFTNGSQIWCDTWMRETLNCIKCRLSWLLVNRCDGVHLCMASSNVCGAMSSMLQPEHILCLFLPIFFGMRHIFFEGRKFWTFQPLSIVMNKHPQDFRWNPDTRCQDLLDLLDAAKAAHLPDIRKVRNNWGVTCEGVETLDESAAYFWEFRWFKVQRFKPHIKCCHSFWRLVLICMRFDEVLHITVFWNDDSESFVQDIWLV